MKNILYILIFILPLIGCNKKWKKTSETTFDLQIVKSKPTVDYLNVNEGTLYLNNFKFTGIRKKGSDVQFTEEFDEKVLFNIGTSEITPLLTYDIPQGDYTKLTIELSFDVYDTIGSMLIKGTFKDSNDLDIPFVFQLEDRMDINILASGSTGSNITILEGKSTHPVIKLDIVDWFEQLPADLFDEADSEDVDGMETVFINKESNTLLYALILDRVGQTATITF